MVLFFHDVGVEHELFYGGAGLVVQEKVGTGGEVGV